MRRGADGGRDERSTEQDEPGPSWAAPPPEVTAQLDYLEQWHWLGGGGFGRVYRAFDRRHNRSVAVKVLGPIRNDRIAGRFDDEVRALGQLDGSDNVVALHDSGIVAIRAGAHSDRWAFLVMELVEGNLGQRMATQPLPWRKAAEIGHDIALVLDRIHGMKTLHLDIKPANILGSEGEPKLADFGVAEMAPAHNGAVEPDEGTRARTWPYAPPESWNHGLETPKTDVYMLASTVVALTRGCPPSMQRPGERTEVAGERIRAGKLFVDMPGAPNALRDGLRRALAVDPSDRPTAYELAGVFRDALRPPRTKRVVAGIAVVAVMGSALTAFLLTRPHHHQPTPAEVQTALRSVLSDRAAMPSGWKASSTADHPGAAKIDDDEFCNTTPKGDYPLDAGVVYQGGPVGLRKLYESAAAFRSGTAAAFVDAIMRAASACSAWTSNVDRSKAEIVTVERVAVGDKGVHVAVRSVAPWNAPSLDFVYFAKGDMAVQVAYSNYPDLPDPKFTEVYAKDVAQRLSVACGDGRFGKRCR